MMEYCSIEYVRAYLRIEDNFDDVFVKALIESAHRNASPYEEGTCKHVCEFKKYLRKINGIR